MLTNDTNQGELQELVENSLNVDTTMISVIVNNEGLKLIPASNDGHGILYEDLPILCERHITSKLSTFDDLQTIKSMGFRVEALDSMTYVGHVTIITITEARQDRHSLQHPSRAPSLQGNDLKAYVDNFKWKYCTILRLDPKVRRWPWLYKQDREDASIFRCTKG